MSTEETYNGYTNRETWALALYINNDQGWQEAVHEALLNAEDIDTYQAAAIIRENVEQMITVDGYAEMTGEDHLPADLSRIAEDIGSLYRVNWDELGRVFIEDLKEINA